MKFRYNGALEVSLALTFVFGVFFIVFGRLDLVISGWFYDPATGFYLADVPILKTYREAIWLISELVFVVILISMVAGFIWPRVKLLAVREASFALASLFLGPGLLVNGILKAYWGRARPHSVEDFGGTLIYTPPLEPAQQCLSNCSFVSGEASLVVTTALVLILLAAPRMKPAALRATSWALGFIAVTTSALRILFGGHFFSDVVFAALFSAIVVFALHRLIIQRPGHLGASGS